MRVLMRCAVAYTVYNINQETAHTVLRNSPRGAVIHYGEAQYGITHRSPSYGTGAAPSPAGKKMSVGKPLMSTSGCSFSVPSILAITTLSTYLSGKPQNPVVQQLAPTSKHADWADRARSNVLLSVTTLSTYLDSKQRVFKLDTVHAGLYTMS